MNVLQTPKLRMFCNKSGRPYHSEAMDEFHEEFNRKGMRFQNNRDEQEFANSFSIVNDYVEMRDDMFKELGLNNKTNQNFVKHNLEYIIFDMRVLMRSKTYLSNPENDDTPRTLSGEELNESILEILEISGRVRQENILQVINENSFFERYQNKRVDFTSHENFELHCDKQIRILISSIENEDEMKDLYEYWQHLKSSENYDEETFLNSLLENKIKLS